MFGRKCRKHIAQNVGRRSGGYGLERKTLHRKSRLSLSAGGGAVMRGRLESDQWRLKMIKEMTREVEWNEPIQNGDWVEWMSGWWTRILDDCKWIGDTPENVKLKFRRDDEHV